jgi:hypothetical protein
LIEGLLGGWEVRGTPMHHGRLGRELVYHVVRDRVRGPLCWALAVAHRVCDLLDQVLHIWSLEQVDQGVHALLRGVLVLHLLIYLMLESVHRAHT